ncbi:hypothetical protein GP486_000024 [Trichoglossum hirsutum]|uniref:Clr5 domain-containing protein n=1 Tax=Trichoglossum hirsutum TaxID=265104 RepID=A0A9P8LJF9_9PEZI|nr:hypothetical protein GP486_000024 [Trichoglossum hirsutum]
MASPSKTPDEGLHKGPRDWERHKETIRSLYIEKNFTLQHLIHEMKRDHAFNATKAQYERRLTKWGFKKNRKKREWIEIAEEVIRRRNEGKDSEVIIGDQIIPSKKLKKEVRRYGRDLINSVSTQGTEDQCFNISETCCSSLAADNAASSSVTIIKSPRLKCAAPQPRKSPPTSIFTANTWQPTRISASSAPSIFLLPSDVDISPLPQLIEASSFLSIRHSTQKAGIHVSMGQLLAASSPLNKSLKAAMIPSEYSELMSTGHSGQNQSSTATNLKIMSAAMFLFRNSLDEVSFDIGHHMFTWFQANYDARIFKILAGSKDPSASAILEKFFRQAVCEGDSEMVRELLLTGIDPNQSWRVFSSIRCIHRSAIQIACEKKYLRIVKLLLGAGAQVPAVTDPIRAPLCCLLGGDSPLDLDLVKQLMDATPGNTLLAYPGCLASAIRRKDLKLIELLIGEGVGDNDIFRFSCSQQGCSQGSSEGNASLPCPTHTITFPVLKKLFIARAARYQAFEPTEFTPYSWMGFTDCMQFFSELLNSLLHQHNQQGVKFMMDAGVCFTMDLLLVLCGIPDLVIVSQLLSEAIFSFFVEQKEPGLGMKRIISNLTNTVSLEPMPMTQGSKSGIEANGQSRDPTENVAMARKIAEALTELPAGIRSQCCKALVKNALWRSLSIQDWPYYKEAFEVILQASSSDTDSSQALLFIAVKARDTVGLHRLLDADLNCSVTALQDLLGEVISWGDVGAFQRLINELTWIQNETSKELDAYKSSFMKNTILNGNLTGVQELFRAGIAIDFALTDGLGFAINGSQQEIVEFLLQSGANPNQALSHSFSHSTPLSEALASKNADILRLLVRFGANPNDVEALCIASELSTAALHTFVRTCKKGFLVKGGVTVLFDAISNSELDTVQLLLKYGVDCNLLIDVGELQRKTCLAAAIESRDCEILKLIIDAGVNTNGVVEQGPNDVRTAFPQAYTALVKAIRCQNLGAVDILLEAGAEVNPIEMSGSPVGLTPLQAAAEQGDLDLVRKLLDLGANANEEPYPYGGCTALQITASKGLIGVASLILERGADVNAKGARRGGRTALETAAENDRIDMVRFLVNSNAYITGPDAHQYWRARTLALGHGHFAVYALLEALYKEKGGEQLSAQVFSSPDVDFDFSFPSIIPTFCDLSNEPLGSTQIEKFGEPNDNQSHSASSVESWVWPLSPISDFFFNAIPDEWSCQAPPSSGTLPYGYMAM